MRSISKHYGTRLTKREQQILSFIYNGFRTRQIAGELCISEYTVANHRKNVLKKRGAKTIKQLIKGNIGNYVK